MNPHLIIEAKTTKWPPELRCLLHNTSSSNVQAVRSSALLGINFDIQPCLAILRLGVGGADILTPNKPSQITSMICDLWTINSHQAGLLHQGPPTVIAGDLKLTLHKLALARSPDKIWLHIFRLYTLVEKKSISFLYIFSRKALRVLGICCMSWQCEMTRLIPLLSLYAKYTSRRRLHISRALNRVKLPNSSVNSPF